MLQLKAKRISENDILPFCNALSSELGGGKAGLKFGIEKNKDGTETIWLFGRKLQAMES